MRLQCKRRHVVAGSRSGDGTSKLFETLGPRLIARRNWDSPHVQHIKQSLLPVLDLTEASTAGTVAMVQFHSINTDTQERLQEAASSNAQENGQEATEIARPQQEAHAAQTIQALVRSEFPGMPDRDLAAIVDQIRASQNVDARVSTVLTHIMLEHTRFAERMNPMDRLRNDARWRLHGCGNDREARRAAVTATLQPVMRKVLKSWLPPNAMKTDQFWRRHWTNGYFLSQQTFNTARMIAAMFPRLNDEVILVAEYYCTGPSTNALHAEEAVVEYAKEEYTRYTAVTRQWDTAMLDLRLRRELQILGLQKDDYIRWQIVIEWRRALLQWLSEVVNPRRVEVLWAKYNIFEPYLGHIRPEALAWIEENLNPRKPERVHDSVVSPQMAGNDSTGERSMKRRREEVVDLTRADED